MAQDAIRFDHQVPMGWPPVGLPEYGDTLQFQFNFQGGEVQIDTALYPFPFHVTLASICDSTGQLLLYTNGVSIANGSHEIIEGGDTLQLHQEELTGFEGLEKRITQGALLLPNPANNGIYYLFHEEFQWLTDPIHPSWGFGFRIKKIYLTTIDMNANEGKGKVIEKNKVLVERDSLFDKGRILATRHANGRDWWVIVPQYYNKRFSKFLVTPEGVLNQPDIVVAQSPYPAGDPEQAMFSPDGTKYASTGGYLPTQKRYFYLYDFDRCTGNLYNQVIKTQDSPWLWGLFFSPDSHFLYWVHTDSSDVTQFDLHDPNWLDNGEIVYEWEGLNFPFPVVPGYGWNGPDGRIYLSAGNGVKVIHRINHPNNKGNACGFERNIEIPSINYVSLPNLPNFRLGPLDDSSCDTLGLNNHPVAWWRWEPDSTTGGPDVILTDLSYFAPNHWHWDFGDGSSFDTTASGEITHLFPSGGNWLVCLTVSNDTDSNTFCQWVTIDSVSNLDSNPSSVVTSGPTLTLQPNPASDQVQVNVQAPEGFRGRLHVVDLMGRSVANLHLQGPVTLHLATQPWSRGMYLCLLSNEYGQTVSTTWLMLQ